SARLVRMRGAMSRRRHRGGGSSTSMTGVACANTIALPSAGAQPLHTHRGDLAQIAGAAVALLLPLQRPDGRTVLGPDLLVDHPGHLREPRACPRSPTS